MAGRVLDQSLSRNASIVCVGDSSKISLFSISIALLPRKCGIYHATAATGTKLSIRTGSNSADDSNSGVETA